MRRIGGSEHERFRLVAFARPQLPQPFDAAGQRELRAPEPLDEVAAAADAERLQRTQLPIDGAVAAGNPFAAHAVASDDPLPFEEQLGERTRIGLAGEEPLSRGPAPLGRRDLRRTLA